MKQTLKNFIKGMSGVLNLSPNTINDFPTKILSQQAGNIERHSVPVENAFKKIIDNEYKKLNKD